MGMETSFTELVWRTFYRGRIGFHGRRRRKFHRVGCHNREGFVAFPMWRRSLCRTDIVRGRRKTVRCGRCRIGALCIRIALAWAMREQYRGEQGPTNHGIEVLRLRDLVWLAALPAAEQCSTNVLTEPPGITEEGLIGVGIDFDDS